jgi:hypothetical protein
MVLQEIEGFSFATALDLDMGYYTIRLDPDASKICAITFTWGKYSYKRLPMDIAGSPDIFQGKILELMESLEYVRAYLDDLLCISKLSLEDHLEKLEEVLLIVCSTTKPLQRRDGLVVQRTLSKRVELGSIPNTSSCKNHMRKFAYIILSSANNCY